MELVSLLVGKVESVVRQVGYLFNYKSNVQNLECQIKDFVLTKEELQHAVEKELRQDGQKFKADVKAYLTKMDEIIDKVNQFLEDERQAKKWVCRYHSSRKATKLEQTTLVELQKIKEFLKLTCSIPLQYIGTTVGYEAFESRTSIGYEAFESRTSIVTQILEELKKDNINMIGVYGMGGVGKTTLVKQVASLAKDKMLFDIVAKVEVKQNADVKRIQEEIAEKFGLKFDENETVAERACILSQYIKDEKKILVIFDDIWEALDMEKLGVQGGMCKLLFTSRSKEVLSSKMGIETNIQLHVLNEKDTWSLFEKTVGAIKDPDVGRVAIEVANECKGLPILVVTVAKALKGKQLHSWKDVLGRLKGKEMLETANSAIEWSYNQLEGEEVKSLILILGMLGVRYFSLKDMLKYTLGLGLSLFKGINTLEEANNKLHSLVDKLKDNCLLLDTKEDGFVAMHDLILDVVRKIASRDRHFLSIGYEDVFKGWPMTEFLEKCTMMSFQEINIPNLLDELECPRLQMFKLFSKDKTSLQVTHNFFKQMKQLKVLDLTNLCIPSLPPSVEFLTSLQTLCLHHCELRDIAIVGKLRSLEILSLLHSQLKQLPKEIKYLTRLRLLDLKGCSELEVIYPDVIKSLTRLEELNMNNSFNKWEIEEAGYNIIERSNASLSELEHLPNLTTLDINIKDANQLPFNFFSKKLKHFKIFIGDVWDWDAEYSLSNTLKLKLHGRNQWDQGLAIIMNRCEDLSLDVFEGVDEIFFYQLGMNGFQRLKKLHVQNNPEISHIVNSNLVYRIHARTAFPILEELSLRNLVSLENICSSQLVVESFKKLKIIKVGNCPKLKNLFSFSMLVHEFLELQEVKVEDCKNMKGIVERKEDKLPIEFCGLRSLTLQSLPKLVSFSSNHSPHVASTNRNSMQLFNDKVVFPKLEALKLSSIPLNKLWDGQLSARLWWIQNLTSLIVEDCDGLTFLCSSSMNLFVQLKTLEIRRCQNMVEIILTEEYGEVKNMDNMFPKLEILELEALGNLEKFCTTATYIEFPCLKHLIINDCTKLGSFIVDPLMRQNVRDTAGHHLFAETVGFPRLEFLDIKGLHKLTTIWHTQLAPDSFCNLIEFRVESCSSLIHIIMPGILRRLHSLKKLYVENCASVEAVFKVEGTSGANHDQSEIFVFRNLTEVEISDCKSLKNVFPALVARLIERVFVDIQL